MTSFITLTLWTLLLAGVRCQVRTIEDIVAGMRKGVLEIDCSIFQGFYVPTNTVSLPVVEAVYMDATDIDQLIEAVYRLPLNIRPTQVSALANQKCSDILDLGIFAAARLVLMTNWSRWGSCNPGTCQERRMRPCVWDSERLEVSCPTSGQQEIRVCQNRETKCLDSCVVLKKPSLTKRGDIKMSWTLNEGCELTTASAHIVVSGISRTLTAPAGINKLLIPFNSKDRSFRIEVDFRGSIDGKNIDLRKHISVSDLKTFDWSAATGLKYSNSYKIDFTGKIISENVETVTCVKRDTTDQIDFECRYDSKVYLKISAGGFLYGDDYMGEGVVRFNEEYCNQNRTLTVEASSRAGETVLMKFTLPAQTTATCKSYTETAVQISNRQATTQEEEGKEEEEDEKKEVGEEKEEEEEMEKAEEAMPGEKEDDVVDEKEKEEDETIDIVDVVDAAEKETVPEISLHSGNEFVESKSETDSDNTDVDGSFDYIADKTDDSSDFARYSEIGYSDSDDAASVEMVGSSEKADTDSSEIWLTDSNNADNSNYSNSPKDPNSLEKDNETPTDPDKFSKNSPTESGDVEIAEEAAVSNKNNGSQTIWSIALLAMAGSWFC